MLLLTIGSGMNNHLLFSLLNMTTVSIKSLLNLARPKKTKLLCCGSLLACDLQTALVGPGAVCNVFISKHICEFADSLFRKGALQVHAIC